MRHLKYLLVIGSFVCCNNLLYSQLNIFGGYVGATVENSEFNAIADTYNTSVDSLVNSLDPANWLHGATVGAAYRFGNANVELTWTERYNSERYEIFDLLQEQAIARTLNTRYATVGLGANVFLGRLMLGGSFNYDYFRIRAVEGRRGDNLDIVREFGTSSRFQLGFIGKAGQTISIAVLPYVRIPWKGFDVGGLDAFLNETADQDINDEFRQFGVRLIFYNGPQYQNL